MNFMLFIIKYKKFELHNYDTNAKWEKKLATYEVMNYWQNITVV